MRTAAVLPVKRFADAKQRLGASISDSLRGQLAYAMARDVLDALAESDAIAVTILVSSEPALARPARAHGALLVDDPGHGGQSAAALRGIERALAEGAERVLCVPGDCPALDPDELRTLLGRSPDPRSAEVVIMPDRHGTGTNGLLLCPPTAIAPSFGPGSCQRHRALGLAAEASVRIEAVPSLLLDIDTGADLAVLGERLAGQQGRAARTRAVLRAIEDADALSVASSA
jgi:2-phospho-L-lactate/phosphoenolpyruvate guanylyltransferase